MKGIHRRSNRQKLLGVGPGTTHKALFGSYDQHSGVARRNFQGAADLFSRFSAIPIEVSMNISEHRMSHGGTRMEHKSLVRYRPGLLEADRR